MFETDDDAPLRPRALRPLPDWYTPEREELWTVERGILEATCYVRDGYTEADLERVWVERQKRARWRATEAIKRTATEASSPPQAALRKAKERVKSAKARVKKARDRLARVEAELVGPNFLSAARAQLHVPECRAWLSSCEATLAVAEADVSRVSETLVTDLKVS